MLSGALRVMQLANWGEQDQVPVAHLNEIRRRLERGERELDLTPIAVRAVPGFLRGEHALESVSLRFGGEEHTHIDVASLPRLHTLRIVGSDMRTLLITGKDEVQLRRGTSCVLDVAGNEKLHEMTVHSGAFDTLRVSDVPKLRVLDAADSRLRRVAVTHAPRLERLDLSMNPLLDEGLELNGVDGLATIQLGSGRLRCVPAALGALPALRELDLRGNRIAVVAPGALPASLVSLDLSSNRLSAAPLDGPYQAGLRDLNLAMNLIKKIPETIGAFRRLETLDLSHNRIGVLPRAIGRCDLLRDLKVASNHLIWLPSTIGELISLESLDLDGNRLLALPGSMYRLIRLECLQLRRNALAKLPARLDELPIRSLVLNGNPLCSVPEPLLRIFTRRADASFPYLALLDLGNTRLTELPAGLGFRRALVQFRLRGNPRLCELPADLSKLRRLRWLDLTGCGFRRVPQGLEEMSAHADVFMGRNPLVHRMPRHAASLDGGFSPGARVLTRARPMAGSITDEVRAWRALVGRKMTCRQEACWNAHLLSRNARAFADLMAALRHMPEFRRSSSTGQTRIWFAVERLFLDIEEHPDLSGYILDEAGRSTGMLADCHRLSFDRLVLAARLQVLAKRTPEQGRVAAGMMQDLFRREQVAALAARLGVESRADTALELDLAYRMRLSREPRGFSFGYDAQVARGCPRFCDRHINEVITNIRTAEQCELVEYMCNSPAWQRYLTRSRAAAYLAVIEGFDARIDATCAVDGGNAESGAYDRFIVRVERDEAVRAWMRTETIDLLTDNPLLTDPA
jgi:Leucine-rich repeat (LRR) protein